MHYGRKSFSKNGKDTIRSILNPSHPLGQREGLTDFDIHEINALYDCSSKRNKPFSETTTKKILKMMIVITILHDNQNYKQNGKKKERQDSFNNSLFKY